jgi:hypothetical protein
MKRIVYYGIFCAMVFTACDSEKKGATDSLLSPEVMKAEVRAEEEKVEAPAEGVILWPTLSVRATGADKGKYLTAVYQGEKVRLLGESVTDENSPKKNVYVKVALSDGQEGWVQQTFMAEGAQAAAVLHDTDVYRRPDLLSKGDKAFSRMDFVAVKEENEKWIQVVGIPQGASWFAEGWILKDKISTDAVDISFAVLAKRAQEEKEEASREAQLSQLLENPDFRGSKFYSDFLYIDKAEDYSETEEYDEYEEYEDFDEDDELAAADDTSVSTDL